MKRFSLTMNEKTHELLKALAQDNKCLMGEVINALLVDFIKEQKDKEQCEN